MFAMFKLKIFFILIFIDFNFCDWIKISNNPDSNEYNSTSTFVNQKNSDQLTFSKYEETHSILNKFLEEEPPSKEWLLYQKQRFHNIDNAQKFSVVEDQLKTSIQIAVPITITAEKNYDVNVTNSSPFSNSKKSEIHPNGYNNKIIDDKLLLQANNSMDSAKDKIFLKRISVNDDFANRTNKFEEIVIENKDSVNSDKYSSSKAKNKPKKNDTPKSATKSKFQEFLNFMKSLQDNLITKTARNIKNKIEKLKELRDKLLINIEDRVLALWPQPTITEAPPIKQSKRKKRGLFEESHSNFPSSETALITICFLTFAVFLIKLVLQVINTLKSKHYNINGLALNTMMEPIKVARNKRNAHHFSVENDYENYLQIISNIVNSTEKLKN